MGNIYTFKRTEIKYMLTKDQYDEFIERVMDHLIRDEHPVSKIHNIYYDTPDYRLIRTSLEKPFYKEKLRLRTYGTPTNYSTSFLEIKKKVDGIVYKRRIELPYGRAFSYMNFNEPISTQGQIAKEIDYFKKFYNNLIPKMVINYDREAYVANEDPDLRITFDYDVTYRTESLDLRKDLGGEKLLGNGIYLMEIKTSKAMPLYLVEILNKMGLYKTSFSKYGECYTREFIKAGLRVVAVGKVASQTQNPRQSLAYV